MIESKSTRRLGESGAIHLPQAAFADLGGDVIDSMKRLTPLVAW